MALTDIKVRRAKPIDKPYKLTDSDAVAGLNKNAECQIKTFRTGSFK